MSIIEYCHLHTAKGTITKKQNLYLTGLSAILD